VQRAGAGAADVTLRGTPLALLAAAAGDADRLVANGRLTLSGDEQLARTFQELARLLRPDLETGLAKIIGRIPSHLATRGLRAVQAWGRAAGRSLLDNSADYLAHESRDLVPRAEAEQFLGGVEALSKSVAQAELRVTQLTERFART
jgi:ubiquinone biosynthesis protein UbiJ